MKITFFDINEELCFALSSEFRDHDFVSVKNISLDQLGEHDAIVTAGNSFGSMSGGIDLSIRNMFGQGIQDQIQYGIMNMFPYGMPIGEIFVIDLPPRNRFSKLLYLSTMRTPDSARPADIAYASSIAFLAADHIVENMPLKSVAIPGLGTGCGKLPPMIAANAIKAGFDSAVKLQQTQS